MMKTEYISFTEEMISEAGSLLAQRHKHNRASLPLLPERFEDKVVATKAVKVLWQKKFKNGSSQRHQSRTKNVPKVQNLRDVLVSETLSFLRILLDRRGTACSTWRPTLRRFCRCSRG